MRRITVFGSALWPRARQLLFDVRLACVGRWVGGCGGGFHRDGEGVKAQKLSYLSFYPPQSSVLLLGLLLLPRLVSHLAEPFFFVVLLLVMMMMIIPMIPFPPSLAWQHNNNVRGGPSS